MQEPKLELILPPELDRFTDFQGVWINDDHLKFRTGLYRGCLAVFVVEEAELSNGDFGVVAVKNRRDVLTGFVSRDFGAVALEKPFFNFGFLETLVFNEDEIDFIGKIVGFSEPVHDLHSKFVVKPFEPKSVEESDETDFPPLFFTPL